MANGKHLSLYVSNEIMNIKKLYKNWTMHNMVAHPVMHVLNLAGFNDLATKVHDNTLPQK